MRKQAEDREDLENWATQDKAPLQSVGRVNPPGQDPELILLLMESSDSQLGKFNQMASSPDLQLGWADAQGDKPQMALLP